MSEHKQDAPIAERWADTYKTVYTSENPDAAILIVLIEELSASEQRERVLRDKLKRVRFGVQLMVPEPQKGGFLRIIDEPELALAAEQPASPCAKCKGTGMVATSNGSSICACSEGWDNNDEG